ncbi:MAG: STAS domain-containing protein [Hydrococcus sp. C42_A2020_068]|uniref:STAS domain-containing protein n=1 Tax=Pleurocapsa sp. PCC 7327 TaxID=118163 RepID=UPI00029FBFA6|nr:STAS domain-containing protein [Pleurocapsa sp. PCC 7327]AFY77580.1 anti-anti-sigma factor [Pleurocapsa sp. PCC 7327]MBF2019186.1 STAS domain-containing protein [Hydrococcus sp. C42_A2020_068]
MNPVIKVLQPSGILDSTKASHFRQEISKLVEDKTDVVVIDFKDVTFMDSSGLGALVLSREIVLSAGAKLFLCAINEQIKMLFELTNVDRVFDIFPSREELEEKIFNGSLQLPSDGSN